MAQRKLARLERVVLREVWGDDPEEFISWLKQSANLSFLGNAIGCELALSDGEVGSADIWLKDATTARPVLVKVQFDDSGDAKIGQMLTGAAGADEVSLVLLADNLDERQRSALAWLNRVTSPSVNLFGLEVDFWQIGDSPFAPTLTVVVRPEGAAERSETIAKPTETPIPAPTNSAIRIGLSSNSSSSPVGGGPTNASAAKSAPQLLEYWLAFNGHLLHRKSIVIGQKPTASNWMSFPMGGQSFGLIATVNPRDHFIAVGLVLSGAEAKNNFQLLQHSKVSIENEIGAPLEWQELPEKPESRILLRRYGVDPDNRSLWDDQHSWLAEKLEKFQKAFVLRVEALNSDDETDSAFLHDIKKRDGGDGSDVGSVSISK